MSATIEQIEHAIFKDQVKTITGRLDQLAIYNQNVYGYMKEGYFILFFNGVKHKFGPTRMDNANLAFQSNNVLDLLHKEVRRA